MLSGHGVLSQTSYFSTQHWKLRATTAWVCRLEGWRGGQAVLRHKARGAVEDKTAGSKGTAHRPMTSSHLPERYFRSLQWFHWDIVFIMKETQPLKPSEPLWERREIWHKCVWFHRVLCCWGYNWLTLLSWLVLILFVCHLSLSYHYSLCSVSQKGDLWLLVDVPSPVTQLKEGFNWAHGLREYSPSRRQWHGLEKGGSWLHHRAVRKRKRSPVGVGMA